MYAEVNDVRRLANEAREPGLYPLVIGADNSGGVWRRRDLDSSAYRDIRPHGCATDGHADHGRGAVHGHTHICGNPSDGYADHGSDEAHCYSHTGAHSHRDPCRDG
jgi:hypothetical protein